MSIDDKLRNINLDMDISFTGSLFILQDFISSNDIMDFQIYNILDIWSGKICTLNKYKEYPRDALFMLIYLSIMLYNDLANPEIKNKKALDKATLYVKSKMEPLMKEIGMPQAGEGEFLPENTVELDVFESLGGFKQNLEITLEIGRAHV